MDKTSMILGWLAGRAIAGQRRGQEKEPVAYLENGVLYIQNAPATLKEGVLEVGKNG